VGSDHPILAHDALERDQLAVLLVRRVRGHVDIAAVVGEDGVPERRRQPVARASVEPEGLGDLARVLIRGAVDVDPYEHRALESARALGETAELLDLVAVEEDHTAHGGPDTPRAWLEPAVGVG
jgi:hypothetical protein